LARTPSRRLGEQGLAGAGRSVEQDSFRHPGASCWNAWDARKSTTFPQLGLRLVDAGDVAQLTEELALASSFGGLTRGMY
jgi:hypothetical protein